MADGVNTLLNKFTIKEIKSYRFSAIFVVAIIGILIFLNGVVLSSLKKKNFELTNKLRVMIRQEQKYKTTTPQSKAKVLTPKQNLRLKHVHQNIEDYVTDINELFVINTKYQKLSFLNIQYKHDIPFNPTERRYIRKLPFIKSELNMHIAGFYHDLGEYFFDIADAPFVFFIESLIFEFDATQKRIVAQLKMRFYLLNEEKNK